MGRRVNRFSKMATKYERIAEKKRITEYHQKGQGLFIYRNKSKVATLSLPKPAANGVKMVGPHDPKVAGSGEFEGDDYFIKCGFMPAECIVVRAVHKPEEKTMNEEKLILDQPDRVTNQGPVEQVADSESQKSLVETEDENQSTEVLLTEDPMEGVKIIID